MSTAHDAEYKHYSTEEYASMLAERKETLGHTPQSTSDNGSSWADDVDKSDDVASDVSDVSLDSAGALNIDSDRKAIAETLFESSMKILSVCFSCSQWTPLARHFAEYRNAPLGDDFAPSKKEVKDIIKMVIDVRTSNSDSETKSDLEHFVRHCRAYGKAPATTSFRNGRGRGGGSDRGGRGGGSDRGGRGRGGGSDRGGRGRGGRGRGGPKICRNDANCVRSNCSFGHPGKGEKDGVCINDATCPGVVANVCPYKHPVQMAAIAAAKQATKDACAK